MLALVVSLSILCFLGGIESLGIPKTFNASNVYLLKPDAYIKAALYAQYPTASPDNFHPYIPGSPTNGDANGYFPHFPMSVSDALNRNWTAYGGGVCVPQKGIPYLPPDSINYYNSATGANVNPFAVYYDSNGYLNGVQIYLNYSTCCDNQVCGCESARASFPVQRYYVGAPFIPFDPIRCPTCVNGPATVQTNNIRAAFPGKEGVNHHFVYFSFRDPDVACAANTTEFYADRILVGFAVPNTTMSSCVNGFVYFPMYFFPTPVGYFDTQACVPFMGVHVQVFPSPVDLGGFNFFGEYDSLDPLKKNIGLDMLFSGKNQNNKYLENFVRFFNLPEPCSSLHVWFGSFLEVSDVCELDPAASGSPFFSQFTIYRPISGEGNNLAHPTWGAEGRPYRNRVRDANVRGSAFDYHAHWGNDSSWKPYLDECSRVTKSLSISYIDGGGARPVPSFLHIWTFGDPVYFCKNLLTNLKNSGNPGFSYLNTTIINQAPVMPQPREISNQLFSRSPQRTDRFTNDLHSFWAFFVVTDVTNSARDTAEMGLYYYPPCDKHRDTKCTCCSAPLANPSACIFGQPYCWVFIGRLVDAAWLTDFQYPPFEPISNTNPRQVWNENTHYLDLSQVYGGGTTTMLLRNSSDPAYMALGKKITVYPFFAGTSLSRGDLAGTQWDLRGDYRANKAPPMKVLTDTFLNNHNRLVGLIDDSKYNNISKYNGPLGRFFLFEDARRLNIAYYQRIIFREYLGALLGRPLNPYDTNADGNASSRSNVETYSEEIDPSLDVTFSHLAYRYAHTELNSNLQRLDSNFDSSIHPDVLLRDSWWNTTTVTEYATAPEDFLRGLVASRQAAAGAWAVDDVRNYMFNDWNTGSDLISTDIFRGRDVGLPTINDIRKYYNLKPYSLCSDITTDAHAVEILYSLYGPDPLCIARIDPYVAGFLEPLLPQSALGETFWNIVFDQFTRLRNGDRFYFENLGPSNPNPLSPVELAQVYSNTLEQTFVDNWEDIQLGQLGSGIFFLKQRQLQTLSLGGNFNSLNFLDYTPPEFEFAQFLKLSPTYGLWWFIDNDELTVRYQTASLGWVGFGIEPDLNTMKNADIYFCQLWPNLTAQITDRYALDVGPPKLDIDLGGEDNILSFQVEHIDGNTICQFTRKLNTGDQWDKPIIKGLRKHMFAFNPETNDLVYHGPTRQSNVYFDFHQTYPVETASDGIVIVYGVLGGLCILFALFIFLSILKQEEYFKFMSPLFCQLLCFGAMICVSSVFPLMQQPPSEDACYAYPWLLGIGFAIMFGCLFAKTWRLWRLFSTKSLKAQVISNKMVFGVIFLFVAPMVAFLIIWSSVDGFVVKEEYSTTEVGSVRFICSTPEAWWPIFAAMIAFVILIGCILTFLIRNLPPEFNDAEPIGFSMYNALLMFIAGTAIGWGISDNINAVVSAQGFPVLFLVWFTLVVLFVPTLWRMWVTKKEPQSFQSSMAMRSGGSNVSGLNTSTSADS